jgi:hypothetical protein
MNDNKGKDWHMKTGEIGLRCLWVMIILIVGIVGAAIGFYLIWQNAINQAAG